MDFRYSCINEMQKSYIPLTFTLRNDPEVTTILSICGNSSFKTGKSVSLNECMIPGPKYLNNIEGILLRWRIANQVAHGDIKTCYHKIASHEKDMSLRRIFLKPDGMGSNDDYWREACFTAVSFGDVLGGSTSQLAINDCAERFISEAPRKSLIDSIYMDDTRLLLAASGMNRSAQSLMAS